MISGLGSEARLSSDEASPTAWSSADIPSGTSSAVIVTSVPSSIAVTAHVIVIVPCVDGIVGDELDGLHDPYTGYEFDEPSFDDVGISRCLARCAVGVDIGQNQSI